jgi:hypothetical protein
MLARTPLARTGTPEEVAEAVRWLLQDAHYSTGQVLHLDGGACWSLTPRCGDHRDHFPSPHLRGEGRSGR